MPRAGRGPASPGSRLLPAALAAVLLHLSVLYAGAGPGPVLTGSERPAPLSVRAIPAEPLPVPVPPPLPDHVSTQKVRPAPPPGERVARILPAAQAASAVPPAASGVDLPMAESPGGYDVPPVPEHGWNVEFRAIDPGAEADTVVTVEMEVSAQGLIRHWHVVESNAPLEVATALLLGLEATPMLPAVRDGEPVDAIVRYELRFLRVPSN